MNKQKKPNTRKLLRRKASKRKRTQCNEKRANKIRHSKRGIKPSLKPTSNSIETADTTKRPVEECSFPEENNRLLFRQTGIESVESGERRNHKR